MQCLPVSDAASATTASRQTGRPVGVVRSAVASSLAAGVVGGCDALARHTGFPQENVRTALRAMLAAGQVGVLAGAQRQSRADMRAARRGRPRAVYAWVPQQHTAGPDPLAWALQHVRTAWR